MKLFILLLITAIKSMPCARAENTVTSIGLDTTPRSVNSAFATLPTPDPLDSRPVIRYTGYMHGSGLDFSGVHQAEINSDSQINYEQRIKFMLGFSEKIEAGIEVRENANFGNGRNANLTNGNWRLHSAFKNVFSDPVFNLTLMPRVWIPASNKAHNQEATFSPDPMIDLAITPRNTRFLFDFGAEYIYVFHHDGAIGNDYANADTSILAPWLEMDYQLNPRTQAMLAYWPEFHSHARSGGALDWDIARGGQNEIDIGGYYTLSKAWRFNPYLAVEMNHMGATGSSIANNLQINFLISGLVL